MFARLYNLNMSAIQNSSWQLPTDRNELLPIALFFKAGLCFVYLEVDGNQ